MSLNRSFQSWQRLASPEQRNWSVPTQDSDRRRFGNVCRPEKAKHMSMLVKKLAIDWSHAIGYVHVSCQRSRFPVNDFEFLIHGSFQ
jgi:hypothetical protein